MNHAACLRASPAIGACHGGAIAALVINAALVVMTKAASAMQRGSSVWRFAPLTKESRQ